MKKIYLMILSLILVSLVLISCTPTDEAGSEGLSDEELEAAAMVGESKKAVAGQATYTLKPITWLSCSDSDGGINSEKAGSVSGAYSQSGKKYFYEYKDVCKENILKEYSCSGSKFVVSSVECKTGCKDGACVPAEQKQVCGNGVKEYLEECDDKNAVNGDGCSSTCTLELFNDLPEAQGFCGDGIVDAALGELCDDGNAVNGDGCFSTCKPEQGWLCTGQPSVCAQTQIQQVCGNGIKEGTEQCDDANKVSGDGCDISCKTEVADLVVNKLSYNIEINQTKKVAVVDVTLKNIGTAGTGTWFYTFFSFNPASAGSAEFGKQQGNTALAAGAEVSGTYRYVCYDSNVLTVSVDYGQIDVETNRILESDENNNMKTIDVDC